MDKIKSEIGSNSTPGEVSGLTIGTDYGTVTPDFTEASSYWNGGEDLPAGSYRISYVTGALKFDNGTNVWSVNNSVYYGYRLTGGEVAPGTSSTFGTEQEAIDDSGGLDITIDHPGGPLGVNFTHDIAFYGGGFISGTNGRPTFRLETTGDSGLSVKANTTKNIVVDADGVGVVDSPTFSGTLTAVGILGLTAIAEDI